MEPLDPQLPDTITYASVVDACTALAPLLPLDRILSIVIRPERVILQTLNANGEQTHGYPIERTSNTPQPCPKCNGEKQVANSDDQEPWSTWANLPPGSDLAVRMGLVAPMPCPTCT